jgi:hypothetical protein
MARPEEQPFDDAAELHVRRPPGLEVGEEAPQPGVVLAVAAVDDDHPDVVLGLQVVLEALGEEHQRGRVRLLVAPEEVGLLDPAAREVEHADEAGDRRPGERRVDSVGERRRHLARPDPVPLHLAVERPPGGAQGLLPEVAEHRPVPVSDRDPAEREARALVEPPALVEEEEVHGRMLPAGPGARAEAGPSVPASCARGACWHHEPLSDAEATQLILETLFDMRWRLQEVHQVVVGGDEDGEEEEEDT